MKVIIDQIFDRINFVAFTQTDGHTDTHTCTHRHRHTHVDIQTHTGTHTHTHTLARFSKIENILSIPMLSPTQGT